MSTISTANKSIALIALGFAVTCDQVKIKSPVFLNSFEYTQIPHEIEFSFLEDQHLIKMGLALSEQSLAADWENENDDHWLSFVKTKQNEL